MRNGSGGEAELSGEVGDFEHMAEAASAMIAAGIAGALEAERGHDAGKHRFLAVAGHVDIDLVVAGRADAGDVLQAQIDVLRSYRDGLQAGFSRQRHVGMRYGSLDGDRP